MNRLYFLRLIRNLIISLFSTLWTAILTIPIYTLFDIARVHEQELMKKGDYGNLPFTPAEIAKQLLLISQIWLLLVVFFWAFVAANRLWPIRGKQNQQEQNTYSE